jgi:hypothetical protein
MNDGPKRWDAAADEAAVRLQRLTEPGSILLDDEAADLRAVLHGLRCYKFERDSAQATAERLIKLRGESERDGKIRMRRIWALVDGKRKTVPMDALREALTRPIAQTHPADTALPAGPRTA